MNKYIAGICFALFFAFSPLIHAYQIIEDPIVSITTNDAQNLITFSNTGNINVKTGGALENLGEINSDSGSIFVAAEINIESGGTLTNKCATFSGTNCTSGGVINGSGGSEINNSGSFTSENRITADRFSNIDFATANVSNYFAVKRLNNNGVFNTSGSTFIDRLDNSVKLNLFEGANLVLYSSGINAGSGTINIGNATNFSFKSNPSFIFGSLIPIYDLVDNFDNQGIINNNGDLFNESIMLNDGVLNNKGRFVSAPGTLFNNSIFHNGGTINNTGTMEIRQSHGLDFNNRGAINNEGVISIRGNVKTLNEGNITNNGNIQITGEYSHLAPTVLTNNGQMYSSSSFNIEAGGIKGSGEFTGDVNLFAGASLNPGNSPGTMTINGDLSSSGDLFFEFAGLAAGEYDILDINGTANFLGGNINFSFIDGFMGNAGDSWDFLFADVVNGWDSLNITFAGLGLGLDYEITGFNDYYSLQLVDITQATTSVPEPPVVMLLALGLLGLVGVARRKKY